jgi:hypothetical protein
MRYVPIAPLFCGALALAAASAAAQTGPAADTGPEIVVTGNPDLDGQVRDFVGALTVAQSGQLSRFERSICPTAVGVSAAQKEAVVARIRQVAKAANIAVGKAKCTPNVLLVVTGDKAVFLEAMLKNHPNYFGELSAKDVRKLGRAPGPAAVWHVQGPKVSADGVELSDGSDELYVHRTTQSESRITAAARPQFAAAAVVVEAKALHGLTTIQLADYAAMRSLAKGDPSKLSGTAPTILKVLETPMGEEVPITMTPWDLAFLRSLYQAPANLSAAAQRSSISRGLIKQLEKGEAEEKRR